jgi:hypothetical protein
VSIPKNLLNALHALRSATHSRLIWADAVCINQMDFEEKSHQVAMMCQIYGTVDNVTVYLGQPTERTEEGMLSLQRLMDYQEPEVPPWSETALPNVEMCLTDILSRTWFTRIWTVQEAMLAQHTTLMCGQYQVSWRGDLRTLKAIIFRIKAAVISPHYTLGGRHTSTLDWSPFLSVLETQMRQAARREGVTIQRNQLDLAFDFRHRHSGDPRDKFYAILGIIENDRGASLQFVPDYNLSLEEVYRNFAAEIQRIGGIEDIRSTGRPRYI